MKQFKVVDTISDARDAKRWRHARKLLTVDGIEGAQGAYESYTRDDGEVSNAWCSCNDEAIDAALARVPPTISITGESE